MKSKIPELITRDITSEEAGRRLDRCLRSWIPRLPQSLIEKAARKGLLILNERKAKPSSQVEEGQQLSFPLSFTTLKNDTFAPKGPQTLTRANRAWLKSLILYEDQDLIILNKPAGIAVQGGPGIARSLDNLMKAYDKSASPRLVHRLDKDTSGILVFARSLPAAQHLTQAFKERAIQKTYWAVVCGRPKKDEGIIDLPLTKKTEIGKVRVDPEKGLPAFTHFRIVQPLKHDLTWLELTPKTGRTHQLRVHCAEGLRTPILGDDLYGEKAARPLGRTFLHLHARSITLPLLHRKALTLEAPLPSAFEDSLKKESAPPSQN